MGSKVNQADTTYNEISLFYLWLVTREVPIFSDLKPLEFGFESNVCSWYGICAYRAKQNNKMEQMK